jgi:hypothetical protein
LDGDNIETQQVLMFFKFLLTLHSGRLANLLALKGHLGLWGKQLHTNKQCFNLPHQA